MCVCIDHQYNYAMDKTTHVLDFARLLASTSKNQRIAILKNITPPQCRIIKQIAYNLIFNTSIKISDLNKKYLNHNLHNLKLLASKRICITQKRHILEKRHLLVKKAAQLIITYLS